MFFALVVVLGGMAALAASGQQGVAAKVSSGITVALSPSSRSLDQGQTTTFQVSAVSTGGFTGTVTLSAAGLPPGSSASWSPSSVVLSSGGSAQVTLTVSTSATTPAAKTDFTVTGTSGAIRSNAAPGQLQVQEVKRTFGLSGALAEPLAPGVSRTLDLQISNASGKSIAVTNLTVAISQVVRTPAAVAANLPCTAADYQITQYAGTYPLTVPAGASSMSVLDVPQAKWPNVRMLDTLQLQDGCKGATVQLTYSGTGQAN
ncbi:hypothetical protein ACIQC5_17240 [Paenarthrobacter sp. NPDC092416]|uniref:hypothetical protein n=1 Tax=Paenarthrobacter sp. NPDC092416 TaxID=3364386 RepID=UPI00382A8EA4